MVKILTGYEEQPIGQLQTGRPILTNHYERLVENQHAIYAEHRARVGGWRWLFTTSSFTLTGVNDTAGNPDLTYYQPKILVQRPQAVDGLVMAVHVYGIDYELNTGIYVNGALASNETMTGTATLEWSTFEVVLGAGAALPLDLYFTALTIKATASIYRIIVDEPRIPNGTNTVP